MFMGNLVKKSQFLFIGVLTFLLLSIEQGFAQFHQTPTVVDTYTDANQSGFPSNLFTPNKDATNNILYMGANQGITTIGEELFISTAYGGFTGGVGAYPAFDIFAGADASRPRQFVEMGNRVFFLVNAANNCGGALVRVQGGVTVNSLSTANCGAGVSNELTVAGNFLVYARDEQNLQMNDELWFSDGNSTAIVADINLQPVGTATRGFYPRDITAVGDRVFFSADNGVDGRQLWVYDPSQPQSGSNPRQIVVNSSGDAFRAHTAGTRPNYFVELDGYCYFMATENGTDTTLFRSNGTGFEVAPNSNGVYIPVWFDPGTPDKYRAELINANGTLYFAYDNGTNGRELWRYDPTGAQMVDDMITGSGGSNPRFLTNVNGILYFSASTEETTNPAVKYGREICRSDGTPGGTYLIKDLNPGINSSNPASIANVDGIAYFIANGDGSGREIWYTDGTSDNTKRYHDTNPGSGDGYTYTTTNGVTPNPYITQFLTTTPSVNDYAIAFTGNSGNVAIGTELYFGKPCPEYELKYTSPTLCQGTGDASPSLNLLSGDNTDYANNPIDLGLGTFTASRGDIIIDPTTGVINMAASTPTPSGTDVITYTLNGWNGCNIETSFEIVILSGGTTPLLQTNTFQTGATFYNSSGNNSSDAHIGMTLAPTGTTMYVINGNSVQSRNFPSGNISNGSFITGLNNPAGITTDASGNVYVADKNSHQIKVYNSSGAFQFNIGTGAQGDADGDASTAQFRFPTGITCDWKGNIYVADMFGNRVRKLDAAGNVSTFANIANGTNFWLPTGITTDFNGNVYLADRRNNRVVQIDPSGTATLLGGSSEGYNNGTSGVSSTAQFAQPSDIAVDPQGDIFVVDRKNHCIRKIADGQVTTAAGTNTAGTTDNTLAVFSRFTSPNGIMADLSGNLYIVDNFEGSSRIRKIFVNNSAGQVIGARGICKGGGGTLTIREMDGVTNVSSADVAKWQRSTDFGQNWSDIPSTAGVVTYDYTSLDLQETTMFRTIVQDGICQAPSNYATIVVFDPPQATMITTDQTVCGSPIVTLEASGASNGDYRWFYQRQSESSRTAIAGETNSTINVSPTETTTYYVGIFDSKCGDAAVTDSVLVTQNANPNNPTLVGAPYARCAEGTVEITVTGATGLEKYVWIASDGITVLKTSSDAADNTFTTPTLIANTDFIVRITNGSCESPDVNFTVTVNAAPADPTLVGAPFSRCGTGDITLEASGAGAGEEYVWYDASNAVIAGETGATYTATGLATTTDFYVAIKNTTTNCESNPVLVTATVNAEPANPTFTTNPVIRCGAGEVTLTANGATGAEQYIWYDDAGATTILKTSTDASDNTFTPTVSASRDYYVTISNGTCPSGALQTITVTINAIPADPTLVGAPFQRCGIGDITLEANGAGAGEEYVWYDASNVVIAGETGATYTATGLAATTDFYVAIKNTTTNCESNPVQITATILSEPAIATFPSSPFERCGTGDITLEASGATGSEQYIWYSDAGGTIILKTSTDAADNTYNITGLAATTDFYVRITNGSCESALQTITATVNNIPTDPTPGGPFTRCDAGTISLTATGAGAGEDYIWYDDAGGTNQVGTGSPFEPNVTVSQSFWVAVSNGSCESNLVEVPVVVYPKPTPAITGATIVCEGSTGIVYSTPATANTFTWTITGTGASITSGLGTNEITVDWGAGPTGTVTLRESSDVTCFTEVSINVDLRTPPTPQITNTEGLDDVVGSGTFCERNTYTFETPFVAGNIYTWDVNGGTFVTTSDPNRIIVTWSNGASGDITVTERIDGTDCEVSNNYLATIEPSPTPVVTGSEIVCENTLAVAYSVTGAGNTYNWQVVGGTIASGQGTPNITVDWGTGPVEGEVIIEETGGNGCGIYDTLIIDVVEYPLAQVRNGLRCGAGTVKVYANYTGAEEYRWYDAETAGNLVGVSTDTVFVTPAYTTTTTLWVAAVNRGNCEGDRVAVTAEVSQENIEADVTAEIINVCARANNGRITLNVSGGVPPYTYEWSNGATTKDIENLGIGSYTVTITDDGSCTTVRTYDVIEDLSQSVEVDAGDNRLIGQGEGIELSPTSPDNGIVSYTWTPAEGLSNPNIANPIASPDTLITYYLEVVNSNGCVGTDSITIDVTTFNLFIPNTFSPNEDGVNDKLQVFGEYVESIELRIYDRLGNMVYETTNTDEILACDGCDNGWDGKDLAGNELPAGNYVWQIKGNFVENRPLLSNGKPAGNVLIIK